ncbi:hypothetical protein [Parapedobacter pyrenivorans]|nr:hypothetical protein [Parapedobacter pyrenivorans]
MDYRSYVALIGIAFVFLLCTACDGPSTHMDTSFYYWKTVYKLDSAEAAGLRNVRAKSVFIRVMDVDNQGPQGEAIPVSAITFAEPVPDSLAVVPVVYIVNHVLKGLSHGQLDTLASNVCRFVAGKIKQAGKRGFDELQVDCDWTTTTRDNYFALLEAIRTQLGNSVRLTSTLRLHQVRNLRSSGVPPADRVLLMCYNMGNLRQPGEHNSILDLHEMKTYLTDFLQEYPLPVDIALPLFSWSVVFRNGEYAGISKRLNPATLSDTVVFAREEQSSLYRLKMALPDAGLREGDVIRREETHWKDLAAAADFLAKHKRKEKFTLLFYHLDNQVLKVFSDEQLQEIMHRF